LFWERVMVAKGKKADVPPFFREQQVAKKIYNELMTLDRPSRRRVLGIVNDYAMNADKYMKSPREEAAPFTLDDEEEV
jgi:hypothetical protein